MRNTVHNVQGQGRRRVEEKLDVCVWRKEKELLSHKQFLGMFTKIAKSDY